VVEEGQGVNSRNEFWQRWERGASETPRTFGIEDKVDDESLDQSSSGLSRGSTYDDDQQKFENDVNLFKTQHSATL